MEKNYSETLNKAKLYFKNVIMDREKYMQEIDRTVDLPKRIEIQTLPLSTSNDNEEFSKIVEKFNKLETKEHHHEPENSSVSKLKVGRKSSNHVKPPHFKIESFDLRNMNNNTELECSKNQSSTYTINQSLSISTTESPATTSVKISPSSSTARINIKCQEVIGKAKNYFKIRDKAKHKKPPPNNTKKSEKNEPISTKAEDNQKKIDNVNVVINKMHSAQEHARRKEKSSLYQRKQPYGDTQTTAKKYLKSKLGIDQKSINVKKENKDIFSNSKTHVYRFTTNIKSFPSTRKESKKTVNQKDTLRSESPQLNIQSTIKTSERLTPAKIYLRSKLGIDEKFANTKKDNTKPIQNPLKQDGNTEPEIAPKPESSAKPCTKLHIVTPTKVRQSLPIQSVSKNREINLKTLSSVNENQKKEKRPLKFKKVKGVLSTKTNIVTNIEPVNRVANKISIELKKNVVLTSSMEELLSKALKIGLKKINRSDLKDLQLKIKGSVQSRNNVEGLEASLNSGKSDLASMQSILESKISDFQTEMERRQKHTFDKIQDLENTIQFRKKQLMEINKNKNLALKKCEKYNK